jgi:hypothetical protein
VQLSDKSLEDFIKAKAKYDAIKKQCENGITAIALELTETFRHDMPDVSAFEVIELLETWEQPQ